MRYTTLVQGMHSVPEGEQKEADQGTIDTPTSDGTTSAKSGY